MSVIHTIRLRLWLPLLILGAVTLLQIFSTGYQFYHQSRGAEREAITSVRELLGQYEPRLEYDLSHSMSGIVGDEIALLGATKEIYGALLLDSDERVLYGSRLEWRGRAVKDVISGFDPAVFKSVQNSHQSSAKLSADRTRIYAYQPILLAADPGQIRSQRVGALMLDYDVSAKKDAIFWDLLRQSVAEWVVFLFFLRFLQFVLIRWLSIPLQHLTDVVQRFRDGDYEARTQLTGNGELVLLSDSFNEMRDQLANTMRQLEDSHENLAMTLYSIGDAVIVVDCEGRVNNMNIVAQNLTGWSEEVALGQPLSNVFHIVDVQTREPLEAPVKRVLKTGKISAMVNHTVLIARDGKEYQICDSASPIRRKNGETIGVVLVFRDVSSEYSLKRAMEESEERYRSLFMTMAQGVVYHTADGGIIDANPAAERILGLNLLQLRAQGSKDTRWHMVHEDGTDFLDEEHPFDRALSTGEPVHDVMVGIYNPQRERTVWIMVNAVPQFHKGESKPYRIYSTFDDLTERKDAEEQIRTLAFYDALTQLPNRRMLIDRLQQAMAASRRSGRQGALLFIDLDHFKILNDTRGHDIGDLLLIEVARRLLLNVREGDTVARLGGDEFVIMLEELSDDDREAVAQTELVGEKVRAALNVPYNLRNYAGQDIAHHSTPSIGACLFKYDGEPVDDLLKRADVAMYQAKGSGRNTIRFFDPAMQAQVEARAALEAWMRHSFTKHFFLHYQVQVDRLGHAVGAEVLLRCIHPERGMLSPLEFIPVAEETGLILPIGQWVLETACTQLKLWESDPVASELQIAVNISARQFRFPDFVEQVHATLDHTGANPARLKLELTESIVLDNLEETIEKMHQLRALGVSFSMDDFGTGYSSLSYLKRLPLQQVKIDQSFVRDLEVDLNDAVIVQAIIAMSTAMGLEVIAEGVETESQRALLEQFGCPSFQGYLFSKPVKVGDFEVLIRKLK